MRPSLLWALVVSLLAGIGLSSGGAPAGTPTTAPAAPLLDEAARDLIGRLKEAEARHGAHRIVCDDAGRVRTLFLTSSMANDENVRAAASLPDLSLLRIRCSYHEVSPEALDELHRLDHLERLELQSSQTITLRYGMALARITNLRALAFSYSDIDFQAVALLSALPHLTTLEFKCCHDLTDADLTALTQLRQLENLDLSFTTITPASLDMLATLPRLKRLIITGTRITEDQVQQSKLAGKVAVKGARPKPPEPEAL